RRKSRGWRRARSSSRSDTWRRHRSCRCDEAEHLLHTVRAFLVLPPVALLYLADAAGLCLWTAAAAIVLDQLMLALDLRESRRAAAASTDWSRPVPRFI